MQTSRSFNTASSSSLRYLHGPPPLPLPTRPSSCSTAQSAPVQEGHSKSVDHVVSALPSSPSFVRAQAASFERRIRHHTKDCEGKKASSLPPVPPLPSSLKHPGSPCSPRAVNVNPCAGTAAVVTSSSTPAKNSAGSALPTRKVTVRKKPAPPVSPSLHAELYNSPQAEKDYPLPIPSAPPRSTLERDDVWGINSRTLSLGLGITFDDTDNERAYELGQDVEQQDELTGAVPPVCVTQEPPSSSPRVVHIDDVDWGSTAHNLAVLAQDERADVDSADASGRFATPLPSTTSDSYDLALLEVDRAFHARIELTLRVPSAVVEGGPVERPIRRGASSITLGRARSLGQPSTTAAVAATRSVSLNTPSRCSPTVSTWLANIDAGGAQLRDGMPGTDVPSAGSSKKSSRNDSPPHQQPTPRAEPAFPSDEGLAPPTAGAASLANVPLFRNKSISTLRRTLSRSRSRSRITQKQPQSDPLDEKRSPLTPGMGLADGIETLKGPRTPKRAQSLKRSRPQQKQWWEHAIVVVGAASPGAFY